MTEAAHDYVTSEVKGQTLPPEEVQRNADTFMTMEYRVHKAVQEGLTTYDELAELMDAFISSKRLR